MEACDTTTEVVTQPGTPQPMIWTTFDGDGTVFHWVNPGAPIPVRDGRTRRVWKDWRCSDCATNVTSVRRSGPNGKKSLCNRCGLKWGRREKETEHPNGKR